MLRLSEFELEEATGVLVPRGARPAFAYSDGEEEETRLLRAVTAATDVRDNTSALLKFVNDWPSYYHLAPGRSNAIRSLELPQDIDVLELGAGCGALARHFGENHRRVDSLEGSPRRAAICRARCRGLNNVRVFCADFSELEFEAEYDVVVLNGVLEYAPSFFKRGDGQDPVHALLRLAKSALRAGGVVLVAIENKMGLKYWSGAPEDHTSTVYEGIQGYPATTKVTTFSKRELGHVIDRAGFPAAGFYHCFPDYKFASTVLSDELPQETYLHNWLDFPAECPGLTRQYLIHEGLAAKSVYEAGLIGEFANSFLVAAGTEGADVRFEALFRPKWIAKRLSVRGREMSTHRVTTLARTAGQLMVTKQAIDYGRAGDIPGAVVTPWTPGDLVLLEMSRAMLSSKPDESVHALLTEYHAALLAQFPTQGEDADGYPLLAGRCIDFLMRNLIRGTRGLVAIDLEWDVAQPIPIDFMLYRSLWNDAILSNHAWASRRIADFDLYVVNAIKRLYPSYGFSRHAGNHARESAFLAAAGGNDAPESTESAFWMAAKAQGRTLAKILRDRAGLS